MKPQHNDDLNCPCCNGKPHSTELTSEEGIVIKGVQCNACNLTAFSKESWNKRHTTSRISQCVDTLLEEFRPGLSMISMLEFESPELVEKLRVALNDTLSD